MRSCLSHACGSGTGPLKPLPRLRERLRNVGRAVAVVLALGGIPGAALHVVAPATVLAPPLPEQAADRDGQVTVSVKVAGEQAPLAHARVRGLSMMHGVALLAGSGETDAAGQLRMTGLPRGELWIVADAPARARSATHLVLDQEPRLVTIELAPEHAIDVVTTDDTGAGLEGAEIEVAGPDDTLPFGMRTGPGGRGHVGRLGPGPWRILARAPGYEDGAGRAARDDETVHISLRKLGAILVHVDEGGAPAGLVRVAIAGALMWPARVAMTDERGEVRLSPLRAGTYALRATKPGADLVSPIELGVVLARGETKEVQLHLERGRWLVAHVTDGDAEDAEPIPLARVTLAEGGLSPFPLESTTDSKGRARLGPIVPGSATLAARAEGFVPRGAVAVPETGSAETRIALLRAGTLAGRVVDARGYPIDGATIEIVGTDPKGGPIFDDPRRASFQAAHFDAMLSGPPLFAAGELGVTSGPVPAIPHAGSGLGLLMAPSGMSSVRVPPSESWVSRADGTFRASPVSPGRIRAIVHHPQYVEAQSDLVGLAPGGEASVEVVMHAGGSLEGRVLDAKDRPAVGAHVLVVAMHGSLEKTTRTASDGSFAFASLPDAVSVTVTSEDDEQGDVRVALEIPEAGRKEVTIHLPQARGPLPILVVDERDRPVEAAQIRVSSLAVEMPLRATAFSDSRGAASLKRAAKIPLRIEVSAPGRAPRVLTTDGSEDSVKLELLPAELAHGEVVEARSAAPVRDAAVTLYTQFGPRRARTDANGAFSFAELAPGSARLRVLAAGFAPGLAAVTIPDSEGRWPFALGRVELQAEATIEGLVLDAHGSPIAGARVAQGHVPTWLAIGSTPQGVAVTDAKGRFVLRQLAEGTIELEAYAPDRGRSRLEEVRVVAGRTTSSVRLIVDVPTTGPAAEVASTAEARSGGSLAVTLGETSDPAEPLVVSVVEGSEAERSGLAPGDALVAVDGVPVHTIEEARERMNGPVANDVVVRIRRGEQTLSLRIPREEVRR